MKEMLWEFSSVSTFIRPGAELHVAVLLDYFLQLLNPQRQLLYHLGAADHWGL